MAFAVVTYGYVALNATDLSAYCKNISLEVEAEAVDATAFSSTGWMSNLPGLKSGNLSLEFNNDVAAAALDSIMWPLLGTVVTFEVRVTGSAVGTSNPKYTGSVVISGWNPIGASVGEINSVSVQYPTTGVVTRATA